MLQKFNSTNRVICSYAIDQGDVFDKTNGSILNLYLVLLWGVRDVSMGEKHCRSDRLT